MAKVKIQNGIGFSQRTGAMYVDLSGQVAEAKKLQPGSELKSSMPLDLLPYMPWSPWGDDNLLGKRMAQDLKNTGILKGIIEGKSRFAINQGMQPAIVRVNEKGERVIEKFIDDPEIKDFLDMNNHFFHSLAWVMDYIGYHRCIGRFGLSKDYTKIVQFQRDDISETRLAKKDASGQIQNVFYSAQWERVMSDKDNRVFKIPLLNPHSPYLDLKSRVDGQAKDYWYAATVFHPGWDEQYYPVPNWMSVYKWVKIVQSVPEMKAALYENTMRAKYIVIIQESYWGKAFGLEWTKYNDDQKEAKRGEVYDEIDEHLVGSKNAGKAIFTTGYRDRDGRVWADIEIKPVDDTTKQGEYLPDSAAGNSEISFALLWNLSITGSNQKAGPYQGNEGGSSVREGGMMQVLLHEVERQQIRQLMNVPKFFNGWNKKFPGLEFIISATVLTTTDTGASAKQVVTGSASTKDPNQQNPADNGTN
jgi:hypothetical protein